MFRMPRQVVGFLLCLITKNKGINGAPPARGRKKRVPP
jgi:hypothetical protein